VITSLHSPHIAKVKALLVSQPSAERNKSHRFIIEGKRGLDLALGAEQIEIQELFFTAKAGEMLGEGFLSEVSGATFEVSEDVMKKMSGTVTPQGILAIASFPNLALTDLKRGKRIAYFHDISDPGNAGTIIRSADAFGFEGLIFSEQSVDPFSAKVVRASVGSIARIPIIYGASFDELLKVFLPSHEIFGLDMDGEAISHVNTEKAAILIFGNEAHGLPDRILENSAIKRVSIPMAEGIESLNLASAATLAMYEMSRVKLN
jgi:TrmH family RNA methyltransferase